jgi:hypothetical protein
LLILLKHGNQFDSSSSYKSKNAIETLFVHDTFNRLTSPAFDTESKPDRLFFFRVLDTRFNIWNYFFYLSILSGIVFLIRQRKTFWNSLIDIDKEKKLLVLSLCMVTSLSVFLSFAATKNNWYLAPVFLFIAIIIAYGILFLSRKFSWFIFLFAAVLIFNLSRHFIYLDSPKQTVSLFFEHNKYVFQKAGSVKTLHIPSQDFFLYLNWYAKKIEPDVSFENLKISGNDQLIFFDSRNLEKQNADKLKSIDCLNNYCVAIIK